MEININVEAEDRKYSVGDIIVPIRTGTPHFIYRDPSTNKYSLVSDCMSTWASGCFEDVDNLIEDLKRWTEFKHYPKSEYQLDLVPKDKNQTKFLFGR